MTGRAGEHLQLLGSPSSFPPLPGKWDGDLVEWSAWAAKPATSLEFHGFEARCEGCGTTARQYIATGRRQPGVGEVVERWVPRTFTAKWGTTYTRDFLTHAPASPLVQFHATRCGWCGHTTVYDQDSVELWTLDETDYGPDGSRRPAGTKHPAASAAEEGSSDDDHA